MKLSLSTNWCNRRIETGEEIADLALSLGFEELELGYHTTPQQAEGFKRRLGDIPVGSVHAFCPVPISAPQGYPELYQLASFDEEDRKMALFQVKRNAAFAAEMGADTVVLHAGRVMCDTWFKRNRAAKRKREGERMLAGFKTQIEALIPELERLGVTLALENLPYYEGFPNEGEMAAILAAFPDAPVKAWFDTGHHRVRACNGWLDKTTSVRQQDLGGDKTTSVRQQDLGYPLSQIQGMHLNDVVDVTDDHLAPGFGKVDFAALKPMAEAVKHVVFEPGPDITEAALKSGIAHIRKLWL